MNEITIDISPVTTRTIYVDRGMTDTYFYVASTGEVFHVSETTGEVTEVDDDDIAEVLVGTDALGDEGDEAIIAAIDALGDKDEGDEGDEVGEAIIAAIDRIEAEPLAWVIVTTTAEGPQILACKLSVREAFTAARQVAPRGFDDLLGDGTIKSALATRRFYAAYKVTPEVEPVIVDGIYDLDPAALDGWAE